MLHLSTPPSSLLQVTFLECPPAPAPPANCRLGARTLITFSYHVIFVWLSKFETAIQAESVETSGKLSKTCVRVRQFNECLVQYSVPV